MLLSAGPVNNHLEISKGIYFRIVCFNLPHSCNNNKRESDDSDESDSKGSGHRHQLYSDEDCCKLFFSVFSEICTSFDLEPFVLESGQNSGWICGWIKCPQREAETTVRDGTVQCPLSPSLLHYPLYQMYWKLTTCLALQTLVDSASSRLFQEQVMKWNWEDSQSPFF